MNTKSKLIQYIIYIINNIFNDNDIQQQTVTHYYENIYNMIKNINDSDEQVIKKYYKFVYEKIEECLKDNITSIQNQLNLEFTIYNFEEKWFDIVHSINLLNTYVFKFLNHKSKIYLGEDFLKKNNIFSLFCQLWKSNIIDIFETKISLILNNHLQYQEINDYIARSILSCLKEYFPENYDNIFKNYIQFIEKQLGLLVNNYEINNISLFIDFYQQNMSKQLIIFKNYFNNEPFNLSKNINKLFIIDNYKSIENILILDITTKSFVDTQTFFIEHYKIFENLNLFDSILNKCFEAIYDTFKDNNVITHYSNGRQIIIEKFNNNEKLISMLNSKIKKTNIEKLLVTYVFDNENFSSHVYDLIEYLDKDEFETNYIEYFCKKILKKNVNLDNLHKKVGQLKRFDLDCTSRLEKMINDIVISNSLQTELNLYINDSSLEIDTKFLTDGIWPLKNSKTLCCKTFEPYKNKIDSFYKNKYTDIQRHLIWNPQYISCTLSFNDYSITVNANLVDFLMDFNNSIKINKTKYSHLNLKKLKEIKLIAEGEHYYELNNSFKYKNKKIKI